MKHPYLNSSSKTLHFRILENLFVQKFSPLFVEKKEEIAINLNYFYFTDNHQGTTYGI